MLWMYTVRLKITFYSIRLLHLNSLSKTLCKAFYLTKVNCTFTYVSLKLTLFNLPM